MKRYVVKVVKNCVSGHLGMIPWCGASDMSVQKYAKGNRGWFPTRGTLRYLCTMSIYVIHPISKFAKLGFE